MLLEFSDLYIPPCVGKFFEFMIFTFLENALNLCSFTHASVLLSKLQVEFFENLFSSTKTKGVEETMFLYQNLIRKCEDDLEHYFIYILYDL